MKNRMILAIFLDFSCSFLFSQPNTEKDEYRQAIETVFSRCTSGDQNASFNQKLLPYYKSFLGNEIVKIDFSVTASKNGLIESLSEGTIVFDNGDLFIRNVSNEPGGFNCISKDKRLYFWTTGSSKGDILNPSELSIVDYLIYFLDPSSIMRSLYWGNLTKDKRFGSRDIGDSRVELTTVPTSIFSAEIIPQPLWLFAMVVDGSPNNGRNIRTEFKFPKIIDKVPEEMESIPENIEWKESDEELTDRMSYL